MKAVDGGPLEGQPAQAGVEGVVDILEWFNYAAGRVPRLMETFYGSAQDVQLGRRARASLCSPSKIVDRGSGRGSRRTGVSIRPEDPCGTDLECR